MFLTQRQLQYTLVKRDTLSSIESRYAGLCPAYENPLHKWDFVPVKLEAVRNPTEEGEGKDLIPVSALLQA